MHYRLYAVPVWMSYALLILAVCMAYGNIYGNEFVFDDQAIIVGNHYLQSWGNIARIFTHSALGGAGTEGDLYRPLQILLDLIIVQIGGMSPAGFHILDVVLHAANACLIFALGRRLNFKPGAALLAALLWAVHPIQTEAVTYINSTADLLYSFFCLIGLIVMLPDFSSRRIFVSGILFIFALLSKETAIMFPLLAAATIFLVDPDRKNPKIYLRTWPLWIIAAAYLVLRFTVLDFQNENPNFTTGYGHVYATQFLLRLYTCLATLPVYLRLIVWPTGLHFERYFPFYTEFWNPLVVSGAVMVLAALAQIVWGQGRRGPALSWGLVWFGAALGPVTGLVLPSDTIMAEHWLYLPMAGLFLGVAQSLSSVFEKRQLQVIAAAAGCLALICGVMTWQQNRVWHDGETLYTSILHYGEPAPRVHANLAEIFMQRGEADKALAELRTANSQSDTIPEVHQNIAFVLAHQPGWKTHPQEAIAELQRAIELRPNYASAYTGLAYIYAELGDKDKAALYSRKARELSAGLP